jgi:hypothetical protein
VGRYEEATGFVGLTWEHLTNRENEPQLHIHATVLNRVVTKSDGKIRALDGRGFRPIKEAIGASFAAALEGLMAERFEVAFALREDGKAREIVGVSQELRADASTRRAQVVVQGATWAAEYVERHGRVPDAAAMKDIMDRATMTSRRPKDGRDPMVAVRGWVDRQRDRLTGLPRRVAELAGHRPTAQTVTGREIVPVAEFVAAEHQELVAGAIATVQAQYSTWTLGNVFDQIQLLGPDLRAVPREQQQAAYEQLAAMAVGVDNPFKVLQLTGGDPVAVPVELRRADGRSIYRPAHDERYCTQEHLDAEEKVVAQARQHSAPTLGAAELAILEVELGARGLGPDQVAAVVGVLGSGRAGDVLIGPAGTGKSYTLATLTEVWRERFGGRVLGLATSQIAANVLAGEGLTTMNTTKFLSRFTPDARGEVADRVRPGDLFVLDESGMSSHSEIIQIAALVAAGGGKLLYTGDNAQLGAVGAGGMFTLLAQRNGAFELDTVRRFVNEWEGPASLRLSDGDVSVLAEYQARGRIRYGAEEQMHAAAVDMAVTDTLAGLRPLLTVATNEQAQGHCQVVGYRGRWRG